MRRDDLDHTLEVLSVAIGAIMEDVSVVATAPPADRNGYAGLARRLGAAGRDIVVLAQAMEVLASDQA